MDSLSPWRISLQEDPEDKLTLVYDVKATDADHAAELAEAAYPGCVVISCTRLDDQVRPLLQLEAYVRTNGPTIEIKGRTYQVNGISRDGDIAIASFKTQKATYHGILCNNARVAGHAETEVWSIIGGTKAREIASFAIINAQLRVLAH